MLKKTVTYIDYNGVERTEDIYFNLSELECTEMQLSVEGGLAEKLEKVIASKDNAFIFKFFKELMLLAYGEKSDDGKRFIKSKELSVAFSQTEAFTKLFMELSQSTDAAVDFVNGILPSSMVKKANQK